MLHCTGAHKPPTLHTPAHRLPLTPQLTSWLAAIPPPCHLQPFQPRIIFSVSHASSVMAHRLSDAIASAVREGSSSGDDKSHTFVKHQVTDDVVHDDYVSSPAHGQYAIYVLNPRGPGGGTAEAAGVVWCVPGVRCWSL
jgi:hypothetical protein